MIRVLELSRSLDSLQRRKDADTNVVISQLFHQRRYTYIHIPTQLNDKLFQYLFIIIALIFLFLYFFASHYLFLFLLHAFNRLFFCSTFCLYYLLLLLIVSFLLPLFVILIYFSRFYSNSISKIPLCTL